MIIAFDETQTRIRDAARGVCSPKSASASRNGSDVWRQFAEMGWTGVVLPERFGGSEGSLIDAGIIALEMGRGGLFCGYPDTVALSLALAERAGEPAPNLRVLLEQVAAGGTALSFALRLDGADSHGGLETGSETSQGLLMGPVAGETMVVELVNGTETVLLAIPLSQAVARSAKTTTRGADRLLDLGASLGAGTVLLRGEAAAAVWGRAKAAYRCLACAQLIGAGRQFLDLATDYAGVRSQFGRLIGSFQAVQHALVETFAAADGAELLTFKALKAVSGGAGPDDPVVSSAVSFTREAVWTMLMKSYDVLGGVGYMEEHPLSRYTRGLLPVLASLGSAEQCEEIAGQAVRKGGYLS